MQLGLSQRRGAPALFLDGSRVAFPLWAYNYLRKFEACHFVLTPYAQNVLSELWDGYYKPPFSLQGKTVLDLGACDGETAWYFLKVLGAARVICVECDPLHIEMLLHNKAVSGLNFSVIAEPFCEKHLGLKYDFVKCDVEGAEKHLISYIEVNGFSKPCVVEVHTAALKDRFLAVGFQVAHTYVGSDYVCFLMNNYNHVCSIT